MSDFLNLDDGETKTVKVKFGPPKQSSKGTGYMLAVIDEGVDKTIWIPGGSPGLFGGVAKGQTITVKRSGKATILVGTPGGPSKTNTVENRQLPYYTVVDLVGLMGEIAGCAKVSVPACTQEMIISIFIAAAKEGIKPKNTDDVAF